MQAIFAKETGTDVFTAGIQRFMQDAVRQRITRTIV